MIKKYGFVLFFVVLIITLMGCSTSTPTTSQIKEDMVGYIYSNRYGSQDISSLEKIQSFKVNEKKLSKKDRKYSVIGEICLSKKDINIKDKINVEYHYIPEQGWKIQSIKSIDDNFTEIEFKKLLQEDDIRELLLGSYIEYSKKGKNIFWNIKDENEIGKIVIKSRVTEHQSAEDIIDIKLTLKNISEELNANLVLSCSFNFYENRWYIDGIDVNDASKEVYMAFEDETIQDDHIDKEKIELSTETQREINLFLSNFTEVFFQDFKENPSDKILIDFAVRHNDINNFDTIEVKDHYGFLSKFVVERSIDRFFNLDIQHQKTDTYDFDGTSYIIQLASGAPANMAVVQEMYDNGDGNYTVYFDEVFSHELLDYSLTPKELEQEINNNLDRTQVVSSKKAIVTRHNFEGKSIYKLLEYVTMDNNPTVPVT